MSLICGYGASEQLLVAISEAAREFGDVSGCAIGDGPAWVLQDKLQEVHSCIVALDDKLHETPVSAAATAGVQFPQPVTKSMQVFKVHLLCRQLVSAAALTKDIVTNGCRHISL